MAKPKLPHIPLTAEQAKEAKVTGDTKFLLEAMKKYIESNNMALELVYLPAANRIVIMHEKKKDDKLVKDTIATIIGGAGTVELKPFHSSDNATGEKYPVYGRYALESLFNGIDNLMWPVEEKKAS